MLQFTPNACSVVLNSGLSAPNLSGSGLSNGYTTIQGLFTPTLDGLTPYGLDEQNNSVGFTDFNWIQQIITLPDPSPFYAVNPSDATKPFHLTSKSTPFNDPHQNGYTYKPAWNSFPFYWDENPSAYDCDPQNVNLCWSVNKHETLESLDWGDAPADPCLSSGQYPSLAWLTDKDIQAECNNEVTAVGAQIVFTTHLAGVLRDGLYRDLGAC